MWFRCLPWTRRRRDTAACSPAFSGRSVRQTGPPTLRGEEREGTLAQTRYSNHKHYGKEEKSVHRAHAPMMTRPSNSSFSQTILLDSICSFVSICTDMSGIRESIANQPRHDSIVSLCAVRHHLSARTLSRPVPMMSKPP